MTAATASPPTAGRKHAFFLVDLNDFKRVNDLHGHALGDRVLQVVAERFRTAARPSDLLARLGGDEFAVLSYNVDRDAACAIGLRFIATLESEIRVGGHSHEIGASIGAALIPDDGTTAEEIIHNADLAMYRARAKIRARSSSSSQRQVIRGKSPRGTPVFLEGFRQETLRNNGSTCPLWARSGHQL